MELFPSKMLSRIICQTGVRKPFMIDPRFVRCASAIISNGNTWTAVNQRNRAHNRLCVVSTINIPVRYRRFDSKNDPKDDDDPAEAEDSHSVRAVYDIKNNPDSTSIATIQVPDELPFLPLVTISKPPLYPRLFRIVEVCTQIIKRILNKIVKIDSTFTTSIYRLVIQS